MVLSVVGKRDRELLSRSEQYLAWRVVMSVEEILTVAMFLGSHHLILRDEARDSSSRLTHGTYFLLGTFDQVSILDVKKFMLDLLLVLTLQFTLLF